MKTMRVFGACGVALLLAAAVAAAAPPAGPVTMRVWPDQLWPDRDIPGGYYVSPRYAAGGEYGDATFYAVVDLPVGARIIEIRYYAEHASAEEGSRVTLRRESMGERNETVAFIDFGGGGPTGEIVPVATTTILLPTVEAGYQYHLEAWSSSLWARIHGIEIVYGPPR